MDLALLVHVLRARARLGDVSHKLAEDGPVVLGSQGQVRPDPLLLVEAALRREVLPL